MDLAADENGYLKTDSLSNIYGIFMAQSGDKDVRPADEGNRAQNGKLGKITYVLDGGTLSADALTEYGSDDFGYAPPTPTKQYYSFAGWEPENIPDESTGNVSFTARWTPDVLGSIQYNLDGGTMRGEKTEYTADDFEYVPPTPVKTDYKFIGWEPESMPTDSTGNVTFTAKWDINTAELLNGEKICLIMKKLAGDNPTNYYDSDRSIKAIQKSNVAPEISVTENPNSIISTSNSGQPVYAWFENGVIKWWSKAEQISADTDMAYLCCGMEILTDISGLSEWDVKKVTNMSYMFWDNYSLLDLTPIANWKVENAINMAGLFQFCHSVSNLTPLANWQVNKVTDMSHMFEYCTSLADLTALTNWQVDKVTNMNSMFAHCMEFSFTNLTGLANWNTGNVTNMANMFSNCSSLKDLTALTNWNTEAVTDMNSMFMHCLCITDLSPIGKWQTNNVTNMYSMFRDCWKLTDASSINDWDISNVTTFNYMFQSTPSHPIFTKRTGTWDSDGTFKPTT